MIKCNISIYDSRLLLKVRNEDIEGKIHVIKFSSSTVIRVGVIFRSISFPSGMTWIVGIFPGMS